MGSINYIPAEELSQEVVLVGRHRGIQVIVLGTNGSGDALRASYGLVDGYLDSDALGEHRVLIVDVKHADVRGAKSVDLKNQP